MIPEKIVEFLHGPVIPWVGTRDARLRTHVSWCTGLFVEKDSSKATVVLPKGISAEVLMDARSVGRITMTAASMPSHETYQCKGTVIDTRDGGPREETLHDLLMDKMRGHLKMLGFPEDFLIANFIFKPLVGIDFRVDEIFDQTPGPGAGKKLV